MTNSVKLKLKLGILIWHILQGNMTRLVFTIIKVSVDQQHPMVLQHHWMYWMNTPVSSTNVQY